MGCRDVFIKLYLTRRYLTARRPIYFYSAIYTRIMLAFCRPLHCHFISSRLISIHSLINSSVRSDWPLACSFVRKMWACANTIVLKCMRAKFEHSEVREKFNNIQQSIERSHNMSLSYMYYSTHTAHSIHSPLPTFVYFSCVSIKKIIGHFFIRLA